MDESQLDSSPFQFVYNITPNSRILQGKSAIPAAFHFTPKKELQLNLLDYAPLTCQCEAVFNPYCEINYNQKSIRCCICGQVTGLPSNYAQHIQPGKLPHEFVPANTTLEFRSGAKPKDYRYGYLFVVDINIEEKQLASIRQQLHGVVSRMPDYCNVGLITYGRNVHVHEFSTKINTNFCINGLKSYTFGNIMELLGISIKNDPQSNSSQINKRFIVPLSEHRAILLSRINNLRVQSFIYVNQRKHSCFGQALNISICMAQASTICTRVGYLVGNPCTVGPGLTISPNFKEQMRSPKELSEGQNLANFVDAKKYYDSFLKRVINRYIILDIFIFTCNQIGFTEMSDLLIGSGGFVVMHEEFRDRIFKQSFSKIYPSVSEGLQEWSCVSEGTMFAYCSKEVAINGVLGQCHSLGKKKSFVSDKMVGKGGTHAWYLGSIDPQKTVTLQYETKQPEAKSPFYFFQVKTIYRNTSGESITRVSTIKREFSNSNQRITEGFDEQAAIVLLGRMCVNKMLYEQQKNIRPWVDQILVKWSQNYANYIKNDEKSFSLPVQMKRLPQFVYHLRRSHFVNRFGISLDESFFKGYWLNRQSIDNCVAMIQPVLLSYSLDNESTDPVAVPLDEEQMKDNVILLLDTYFVVLEWFGEQTKSWQDEKYHEKQGFEHIAELFNSPEQDIDYIMGHRFPAPCFYKVHPYHSKQRYLKSRVNPKKGLQSQHQNMITDDSDLRAFTQHLMRVVTRP